jgi:hypothetical protein
MSLFLENQKPPSDESGFFFPNNVYWQLLMSSQVSTEVVVDTSKAQFIRSQPEPFFIQALAVDPDRGLCNLCVPICIEMHRHFPGGIFYVCCIVSAPAGAFSNIAPVVTAVHDPDGVEMHERRAVSDFDVDFSSITQIQDSPGRETFWYWHWSILLSSCGNSNFIPATGLITGRNRVGGNFAEIDQPQVGPHFTQNFLDRKMAAIQQSHQVAATWYRKRTIGGVFGRSVFRVR